MMMTHAAEDLELLLEADASESERVTASRYREARAAGMNPQEARHFADSLTDIGWLRTMVAGHASPDLIARTLI